MNTITHSDYYTILQQAVSVLNDGYLDQAKLLILQLVALTDCPSNEHFRVLAHIAFKEGNFTQCIDFVKKGLKSSYDNCDKFYSLKGFALQKLESHEEARQIFKESLILNPHQPEIVHYYFSYALKKEDLSLCEEALTIAQIILPSIDQEEESDFFAKIQSYQGIAYFYLQQYELALNSFLLALKTGSLNAEYFFYIGCTYFELKNDQQAIEYLEQGFLFHENNSMAFNYLIKAYFRLQNYSKALLWTQKASSLFPKDSLFLFMLARIYLKLNKDELVLDVLNTIFSLSFEESLESYLSLIEIYKELQDLNAAIKTLHIALNRFPNNEHLHNTFYSILRLNGDFDLAEKHLKKALETTPSNEMFLHNLSLHELTKGNFKKGWELYSYRIAYNKNIQHHLKIYTEPMWKGEDISNKGILIHHEQGIGDSLQFCRYLPWLSQKSKTTFFLPHNELIELLEFNQKLLGATIFTKQILTSKDFSYQAPLLNLPLIHETDLNNLLTSIPYLQADPEKKTPFQQIISSSKLKVGIFWQGSPSHCEDRYRSNKLKDWLPLIQQFKNKVQFYSLQKGFGEEQLNEIDNDGSLIPLGPYFHNYGDTAAAIDMLDLVISVDSSVVHLCGALGKTTWILLPLAPDWRWLLDREDSPWYPTARLFRKQKDQTWSDVLSKVAHQLQLSFF